MKYTGADIIARIAERLEFENVRCHDSDIVSKLGSLTAAEIQQLFGLGNVSKWHNDKIEERN